MRKILLSAFIIIGAGAAMAGGMTGAFFSDTEKSLGNSFVAGAIDLKIDNDSYYNRNRCTNVGTEEAPDFQWVGQSSFPVPGTPCETSFPLSDLDEGLLFFNFTDLKPDDEGEDTISIHVQNDAFACMDVILTSNDDRSTTEPESQVDVPENITDAWDGELALALQFFWWADDGDNVYEVGENALIDGPMTLFDLATTSPFSVALADIDDNAWGEDGPIPANETVYIGKAWCFGTMELAPVPAGQGENPSVNPGVTCDGSQLHNQTQSDGATLDFAFRAVQARHNDEFQCIIGENETRTAKVNVIKHIVNDNGGNNDVGDFQLFVDNGTVVTNVSTNSTTTVLADTYTVGETGVSGYVATFSGDCDAGGNITLNPGDEKYCIITNNDLPATITLVKSVINNNGGTTTPAANWGLRIDGAIVPHNTSVPVTANSNHFINEDGRPGYHFVSITGAGCPGATSTPVMLNEGESITCTITNDDNTPPPLADDFGSPGICVQDIPGWEEDPGESCTNGTVSKNPGSNDDSASPQGGNFALLGNQGFICKSINATGFQNLVFKYYWRGDSDAEVGDNGAIRFYTGGTCAAPTGEVASTTHSLTVTSWSALQTVNLPASLNNTSFLIKFTADTNNGNESFRVDTLSITGDPI